MTTTPKLTTVTTDYTVLENDSVVVCNPTSEITVTLPSPAGIVGRTYTIKNDSDFTITIATAAVSAPVITDQGSVT